MAAMQPTLPPIPAKRYFTIGEVGELCAVKPHVLRYWEQEFSQLRPMKRQGNRRYYQHHEVLMIRRIRELLYEQGFSINGARLKLAQWAQRGRASAALDELAGEPASTQGLDGADLEDGAPNLTPSTDTAACLSTIAAELREIRRLLTIDF